MASPFHHSLVLIAALSHIGADTSPAHARTEAELNGLKRLNAAP